MLTELCAVLELIALCDLVHILEALEPLEVVGLEALEPLEIVGLCLEAVEAVPITKKNRYRYTYIHVILCCIYILE